MKLRILNTREKKKLADELNLEYGLNKDTFNSLELLQDGGDFWLTTRQCLQQNLTGLNVDSLGLQIIRNGRPTIHGVELLFRNANMTELTEEEAHQFTHNKASGKVGVLSYRGHPLGLR
ncbi:MAG: hypothetical protein V1744_07510 [Candidatus Altiarchaeota archaeon]